MLRPSSRSNPEQKHRGPHSLHRPQSTPNVYAAQKSSVDRRRKRFDDVQDQLDRLTEQLKDMQYELSFLGRIIKEKHGSHDEWWSMRRSQKVVILSNFVLGWHIFASRFGEVVRARARISGNKAIASRLSLSSLFLMGVADGLRRSTVFFLAAAIHAMAGVWQNQLGFSMSTIYSIMLLAGFGARPDGPLSNMSRQLVNANLFVNFFYILCRYYFMQGLKAFNDIRIL